MRVSHVVMAGLAVAGFFYLAGYAQSKYTDHERKGYSVAEVAEVDRLILPTPVEPMKLVHPKTARERAEIIARIWGIKAR